MSAAAWATLAVVWTLIGFFTIRFFLQVLRLSNGAGDGEPGRPETAGDSREDRPGP